MLILGGYFGILIQLDFITTQDDMTDLGLVPGS